MMTSYFVTMTSLTLYFLEKDHLRVQFQQKADLISEFFAKSEHPMLSTNETQLKVSEKQKPFRKQNIKSRKSNLDWVSAVRIETLLFSYSLFALLLFFSSLLLFSSLIPSLLRFSSFLISFHLVLFLHFLHFFSSLWSSLLFCFPPLLCFSFSFYSSYSLLFSNFFFFPQLWAKWGVTMDETREWDRNWFDREKVNSKKTKKNIQRNFTKGFWKRKVNRINIFS